MRWYLLGVSSFIFLFGCSRMSEDQLLSEAQKAYTEKDYPKAIKHFEELVDRFPKGQFSETSQLRIGTIYSDDLQDFPKAIESYRKCMTLFPESGAVAKSKFLIGFVFNNYLHQYDSARAAYEEFLAKYPNHEMAASAKFEIETMGKDIDQIFTPLQEPPAKPVAAEKKKKK